MAWHRGCTGFAGSCGPNFESAAAAWRHPLGAVGADLIDSEAPGLPLLTLDPLQISAGCSRTLSGAARMAWHCRASHKRDGLRMLEINPPRPCPGVLEGGAKVPPIPGVDYGRITGAKKRLPGHVKGLQKPLETAKAASMGDVRSCMASRCSCTCV